MGTYTVIREGEAKAIWDHYQMALEERDPMHVVMSWDWLKPQQRGAMIDAVSAVINAEHDRIAERVADLLRTTFG